MVFYQKYAGMQIVHRREAVPGKGVAWLSDLTRPFVLVLLGGQDVPHPLSWPTHIGIAVKAKEDIDRIAQEAEQENCLLGGPDQRSETVGYITWIEDPGGHTVEFSYGQAIAFTVDQNR